jgi:hypothetical protein
MESRVLRQLIAWTDEYLEKKKATERYVSPPTTDQFTKHFHVLHEDMLACLNRLERRGLLEKERRRSRGISGHGFDGSLHSSVLPTAKGRESVANSGRTSLAQR